MLAEVVLDKEGVDLSYIFCSVHGRGCVFEGEWERGKEGEKGMAY